jgi:predicted amidohydrolase YtcJ
MMIRPSPSTCPPPARRGPADIVLLNGYVYTVDRQRTVAEALAVKGDSVIYVGDNMDARSLLGRNTRAIDLQGKMVLPAFVDSHCHATSAVSEIHEVPLQGIGDLDGYRKAIRDFAAAHPGLEGLRGIGWVNAVFGPGGPTKESLDQLVPAIPAVLFSQDYHSVWVNSIALARAGITRDTADPRGGIIERDGDGHPSGTLRENAMDLVENIIRPYTSQQVLEGLKRFQAMAASYGVTTAYIPDIDEIGLEALRRFDQAGEMGIRFPSAAVVEPNSTPSVVEELVRMRDHARGAHHEIVGAKLFVDGVVEGGTAYLEEPYQHTPETRGELLWEPAAFSEMCSALDRARFQIHVHSIGDAATRIALDGFAFAREQNGQRDSRHAITHLQLVNPRDIGRFADLQAIAVPQPYWFVVDAYYRQAVQYLGQERADQQYPMRSFFDKAIVVASASDYPVTVPPNPMLAIEIGATRTVPVGAGAYVDPDFDRALAPSERVTVEDMIASFTVNGAHAAFLDNQIGSLETGKKADLIVLDQNIHRIKPTEIHDVAVVLTLFEGREVYRHSTFSE